ncbi:hypothetical protein D3C76_1419680 [compost metagenome]
MKQLNPLRQVEPLSRVQPQYVVRHLPQLRLAQPIQSRHFEQTRFKRRITCQHAAQGYQLLSDQPLGSLIALGKYIYKLLSLDGQLADTL